MNTPILSFGEYLTRWMDENNYTCASLSLLTAETGAATIARMMRGQLGYQRCARFINELSDAVDTFGENTLREMREAVEVTRYGKDVYIAKRDFLHMLHTTSAEKNPPAALAADGICSRLYRWAEQKKISILCLGLSDSEAFRELTRLCELSPDTQIIQYLEGSKIDQLSALLGGALRLAFKPNYEMYALSSATEILVKNVIIAQREDGAQLVLVLKNGTLHTLPMPQGVPFYDFCRKISATYCTDAAKINRKIRSDLPEGYALFMEDCAALEKDTEIYQVKSDLGIEYIPVEIPVANFAHWANEHDERFLPFVDMLADILRKRHRNLMTKKEPTYLLMSRAGMRRFAETGRLTDHPFCLHPFTPTERKTILRHLIRMANTAPMFVPLFFNEEEAVPDYDFIGYGNGTLLVCASNANYNLADYTEFNISSEPLLEQYKRFYMGLLVKKHALSKKASLDFLETLEASIPK